MQITQPLECFRDNRDGHDFDGPFRTYSGTSETDFGENFLLGGSNQGMLSQPVQSNNLIVAYPTPPATKVENGPPELTKPPKPPRKRPNRYANASPSVIERRRHQNRDSQRAYRKRKDDEITKLRDEVDRAKNTEKELRQQIGVLSQLLQPYINHRGFQMLSQQIPQAAFEQGELVQHVSPPQSEQSITGSDCGWEEFPVTLYDMNPGMLTPPADAIVPMNGLAGLTPGNGPVFSTTTW